MGERIINFAQWAGPIFDLLKIITGGVLAALITLWVSGRRLDQDRHRAARHLAIRLIDVFDRYAVGCSATITGNKNSYREDPYDYASIDELPVLDPLPDEEAGWRAIDPSSAVIALTFGNQIAAAKSLITAEAEYGDADSIADEVDKQSLSLGNSALLLAMSLRNKYKLSGANYHEGLLISFLEEETLQNKKQALKIQENEEWWAAQETEKVNQ